MSATDCVFELALSCCILSAILQDGQVADAGERFCTTFALMRASQPSQMRLALERPTKPSYRGRCAILQATAHAQPSHSAQVWHLLKP